MADERKPGTDGIRSGDYRTARIASALTLTGVVVALLLVDAVSSDYDLDPIVLVTLMTTILTLLGLEAASVLRGRQQ